LAVVHRTYARALYDAARDKDRVTTVREELADFVQAMHDVPELRAILENPQVDRRAKAAALESLLADGDELLRNFLRLLAEKGRVGELDEVQREFERIVAAAEGQLDVELTTAYDLSEDESSAIVDQIAKASGRRVRATKSVDPALIGGIVLQVGSRRVDASIRGRLERLRRELTTRS
jgi:F-type H+-transporting ATPase subunit delta